MGEHSNGPGQLQESIAADNTDRNTFTGFLRTEIDRLEAAGKRPGWTTWALFGAGAVLVSHFLGLLEKAAPNWTIVAMVFVGATVTIETITHLTTLMSQPSPEGNAYRRFRLLGHQFAHLRLYVFATVCQAGVLLVVIQFVSFPISPVAWWSLHIYIAILFFLVVTAWIVSLVPISYAIPLEDKTRFWAKPTISFVICVSAVSGIIGISIALFSPSAIIRASVSDWRVGLTLTAFSYVLLLLAHVRAVPPLLPELKTVERRLAFGQLTLTEAKEKADRILHGMTLSDLLGPLVAVVIRDLETIEKRVSEVADQVVIAEKMMSNPELSPDEKHSTVAAILDADVAKLRQPDTIEQSVATLRKKVLQIRHTAPWMMEEANSLLARIDTGFHRLKLQNHTLSQQLNKLSLLVMSLESQQDMPSSHPK